MTIDLVEFPDIPAEGSPLGLVNLNPIAVRGDRGFAFGRSRNAGIQVGKIPGYWTAPYRGVITAVNLSTDKGGYTIKFWKNRLGQAPTAADSINRYGFSIQPPDTHVVLFDLGDFTDLDVVDGDTFSAEITAINMVTVPTDIAGSVIILQTEK